ncbi:MAG: ATP-binding cassette domain-containing protein, partial [Muribaculaceae bacterium]|nr:ATP-binding cassette domain-containing protein [Muribaculaceae bacterium]
LLPGLIQSHTAFSRMSEIETVAAEVETMCGSELPEGESPVGLVFRDVTFRYPGNDKPILDHFSHVFRPGSKTAIMGETGAGKSTLLRLALALLRPQEGEIGVFTDRGGTEIYTPVSSESRKLFVYVPQGNSLLSGTIRHNLRIGNPTATEEEMKAALHDAAADFVFDLKFGLETTCGERGDGLSEGQAQRIAIARGLLTHGSILLLDEISAALDEETETLLMRRLSERAASKTILFITHRNAVLPFCDNILKGRDGRGRAPML